MFTVMIKGTYITAGAAISTSGTATNLLTKQLETDGFPGVLMGAPVVDWPPVSTWTSMQILS